MLSAMQVLGIDEARASEIGLALYKVAMPWPLEPRNITAFAEGLEQVIVVEEKRGLIEEQLRGILYGHTAAPASIVGKRDEQGETLFPAQLALNPMQIAAAIGARVADAGLLARAAEIAVDLGREAEALGVKRTMYFCAGCPHNSSTHIPEGARGYAGIGCSWMAQMMDRGTEGYTHMGGDGVSRMVEVVALDLPSGEPVTLAPGSMHLMLMGLSEKLEEGTDLPLILTFASGARMEISVPVLGPGAMGPQE